MLRDPREGEAPEGVFCDHGVDLSEADCWACLDAELQASTCLHGFEMGINCRECQVAAETQLAEMFVRVLNRIRQTEDEQMGAALAARFGG